MRLDGALSMPDTQSLLQLQAITKSPADGLHPACHPRVITTGNAHSDEKPKTWSEVSVPSLLDPTPSKLGKSLDGKGKRARSFAAHPRVPLSR